MEEPDQGEELNSLEDPGIVAGDSSVEPEKKPPKKRNTKIKGLIGRLNIYLLLFILIIIVTSGFTFVSIQRNKKAETITTLTTQELTAEDLSKLSATNSSVGDPKQTLSVESNAIFAGKVLIRDSLDVAGGIKIGGSISLAGLTVAGTSSFDQIQGNKLSISGDANIQGQLTVQKTLTTTGGASFGGPISAPQITVQSFQVTGDLQITRHYDAGGGTPGKTDGGALGAGGTSSVSGTDTAGTITINTGGGPAPGCMVTVNFSQPFNATPHVVVTPVGSAGAGLNYYVTRNTNGFSLCTTNSAPGGTNFSFDYIVID
jgi:cytoskeletal protein CcmA (bactofilin family)